MATATAAAPTKPVTVEEYLRYVFSEEELRDRAKSLAMNVQRQTQTGEEQKAAQAQFKERLERFTSEIGKLSRDINNGWEMRTITCRVLYHSPVSGTKRIVREDTGELVHERPMTRSEMQENLFTEPTDDGARAFFERGLPWEIPTSNGPRHSRNASGLT